MKSNVKRVEGKTYHYWSDKGVKECTHERFYNEDDYRHSVGNYFETEEDVVEFTYHVTVEEPLKQEFLPAPSKTSEEEKFVQIVIEMPRMYALTSKGRLFVAGVGEDKWQAIKNMPDFKNIK